MQRISTRRVLSRRGIDLIEDVAQPRAVVEPLVAEAEAALAGLRPG
jgi:hypothetical protein